METDDALRIRVLREWERRFGPPPGDLYVQVGAALNGSAMALGLSRLSIGGPAPDPFSTSLTEALRREDAVTPHPVTQPETEAEKDALWKSIEDYGRGG